VECKFITNGLALDYSGVVKPCCVYKPNPEYQSQNHISKVDLVNWHSKSDVVAIKNQLNNDQWPSGCWVCRDSESQGRGDSMRLNGESAYHSYGDGDITLEIRPGNVCNFACQTCWPQASSRVANFYTQAGISFVDAKMSSWDYTLISPIKHRLKNIVVLGGEPFYDPKCIDFFKWLVSEDITCPITIFTNGSTLRRKVLQDMKNPVTLVFSMDAMGTPAEYIRIGTDWKKVLDNYKFARSLPHVDVRVNITTSPYNYLYLEELVEWLSQDWPSMVTFGIASSSPNVRYMNETVFPMENRAVIVDSLKRAQSWVAKANTSKDQQINAHTALQSIINNLETLPYDSGTNATLRNFIVQMDRVKHIRVEDYCKEFVECLCMSGTKLANEFPEFL
jgi:MoaA/NifB/PqqE/SkfB family radical SAM enzyme